MKHHFRIQSSVLTSSLAFGFLCCLNTLFRLFQTPEKLTQHVEAVADGNTYKVSEMKIKG